LALKYQHMASGAPSAGQQKQQQQHLVSEAQLAAAAVVPAAVGVVAEFRQQVGACHCECQHMMSGVRHAARQQD
jgi:hypothetical protein